MRCHVATASIPFAPPLATPFASPFATPLPTQVLVAAVALCAALTAPAAVAQANWPTKPIRLVVPFPPASSPDVLVRAFNERLGQRLGQPVVIENRPGAGGVSGTNSVAKAEPDGYTLLVSVNGPLVYNTQMSKSLPYDPFKDFAPVTLAASQASICAASTQVGAKNMREFTELMRRSPGKFNYGSTGVGSLSHLAPEIMKMRTDTFAVHIPYASSPLAVTAILQGDVQYGCLPPVAIMPQVLAGKMVPLAVTTGTRSPLFPDIPTLKETGFPDVEATAWMAIVAPARTPPEIVRRLNAEIVDALKQPETVERLRRAYIDVVASTPEGLARHMQDELTRWTPVIKRSGATLN
jgi:tripartite-type tricarboxylate transporter receptor subunit TctC